MAREALLKGKDSRLAKIVLEVTVPVGYYDKHVVHDRLRDFMLGPQMPGWYDSRCFQLRIEEQDDALQVS